MLGLLVIIVVVFLALAVLLLAGTLFVQGYIYSEPAEGMAWRAAAAGGVLAGFLGLWMLLDYAAIDPAVIEIPYHSIFHFSPTETKDYEQLWSVTQDSESGPEKETLYTRQKSDRGAVSYLNANGEPWRRETADSLTKAILVEEASGKARFEPRLQNGKYPPGTASFPVYYEVKGRRVMENLGKVSVFRWGQFLLNLFLNAFHLALWFVCLWLILRFQWTHALIGAVVIWVVLSLAVLPLLLGRSYEAAKARGASTPKAAATTTLPL